MRVLVADDDVVVPMILGLELDDVDLIEATRASEALALARSHRPDAIIVDRRLPDGDGISLIRRLRMSARTTRTPILMLTAHYDPADEAEVIRAGADAYLPKPFEARLVHAYLRAMVECPAADRRERRLDAIASLALGIAPPPLVIDLQDEVLDDTSARRHWWNRRAPLEVAARA